MKVPLLFIFVLFCCSIFSQSSKSIDSLIKRIDDTTPTDSITIVDSSKWTTRSIQVKVTACLKGDTLLKTIARFNKVSVLRITYYEQWAKSFASARYVKDIDTLTNEVLLEVYGNGFDIYKSTIVKIAVEPEAKRPYDILSFSDYSINIGFALVDRKACKYTFKARLTKVIPMTIRCGQSAEAIVQKFEVISTTFPKYDKQFVLLVQPCPELLEKDFFVAGQVYEVNVATNSGVTFGYFVHNLYQNENLPTFWTREIKRAD
jgi:hypothetical protein